MLVLQALLLKAYFAILIFVCVMASHDYKPWFFLGLVMFIFCQMSMRSLVPSNVLRRIASVYLYCNIFFLWLFLYHRENPKLLLFNVNYAMLSQFINDNALPYFQYRQTLFLISMEIEGVCLFIWKYMKITKTSPLLYMVNFLWLSLHAVVVVFVINRIFITLNSEISNLVLRHFMDTSLLVSHPKSFLSVEALNTSRYESPVAIELYYANSSCYDKSMLINTKEILHLNDSSGVFFPYFYGEKQRC